LAGEDVNSKNYEKNQETPIYYAIRQNNFDFLKFLVEHGANVNVTNNYGQTPLDVAIIYDNFEIIEFLLEHGAKFSKDLSL
jgi:ankyrin repeat protein